MQWLENGLQFNAWDGSVISINHISSDVFWPCNRWSLTKKNWTHFNIFYWCHHISTFSPGNLAFTCFCSILNISFIFLLIFHFFFEFQYHFYKKTSVLIFTMGIFYWNFFFYLPVTSLHYKKIHSCSYGSFSQFR